jgi:hypothetical protein
MKKIFIGFILLCSIIMIKTVYAGYGIDCTKPVIETDVSINTPIPFTFTCQNNSPATFSYFDLTIHELDNLQPATVNFTVTWPHTAADIRPGDVGVVSGTIVTPDLGEYSFDFDKAYGGEVYCGIFCENGASENCIDLTAINPFLFVSSDHDSVFRCPINTSDGQLEACTDIPVNGMVTHTSDVVITSINQQLYLYTTSGFGGSGKVQVCSLNQTTGGVSNCQLAGSIPAAIDLGIAFYTSSTGLNAYISDGDVNGQVWECPVGTNGVLGTCNASGPNFSNGPAYLGFKEFGANTYAYVPDGNSGNTNQQVWQCLMPSNGAFPASCVDSGVGAIFNGPIEVTWLELGSMTYAYITNYTGNLVSKCTVNSQGKFVSCGTTATNIPHATGIVIIQLNNNIYAYVSALGTGNVVKCPIDSLGNFGTCQDSGQGNIFVRPRGIAYL